MRRFTLVFYVYVGFIFISGSAFGVAGTEDRQVVLLLHSYHQGFSWTDSVTAGVQARLDGNAVDLNIEYLDSKRRPFAEVEAPMVSYLKAKYEADPPRIILVSDNNALTLLRTHRDELFPASKIVFCGINNYSPLDIEALNGRVTGVTEQVDPIGTLRLMKALNPSLKRVIAVSGTTETAKAMSAQVFTQMGEAYLGLTIEYWEGLTQGELEQRLGRLGSSDAVLLLTFNRDSLGQYFTNEESGRLISNWSPVPVYGLWDFYLGTGVIGGSMASGRHQGELAAGLAIEFIKEATLPPVQLDSPNRIYISYPDFERHGLSDDLLPIEAIVIGRAYTSGYGPFVYIALFVYLLASGLSVFLIFRSVKQRRFGKRTRLVGFLQSSAFAVLIPSLVALVVLRVLQESFDYKQSLVQIRQRYIDQNRKEIEAATVREAHLLSAGIEWLRGLGTLDDSEIEEWVRDQLESSQLLGLENYFILVDAEGIMRAHSFMPRLEGTYIGDLKDASGVEVGLKILGALNEPEGCYFRYQWPKPGSGELVEKLTYARRLDGLNWILATGVYLDEIDSAIAKEQASLRRSLLNRISSILAVGLFALLILFLTFRWAARAIQREIGALLRQIDFGHDLTNKQSFAIEEFQRIADHAEQAFLEIQISEEKFERTFRHNSSMMALTSMEDHCFVDVNDQFLAQLGVDRDQVYRKQFEQLDYFKSADLRNIARQMEAGMDIGTMEIEFHDAKGAIHQAELRSKVIQIKGQEFGLWEMDDVTERKRNENRILRLSLALEQSPVSVVMTDLRGKIEYVNPKFCEITGYSKEEAIGQNPRILKSGETNAEGYRTMWKKLRCGESWRGEFHNKRKDGTLFWELAIITSFNDASGKQSGYLAVKEDISEHKQLEAQLRQAQKLESVGQLAAGVSHEINTPMQYVCDNLHFLKGAVQEMIELIKGRACDPGPAQLRESTLPGAPTAEDIEFLVEEVPLAIKQAMEGAERVTKIVRSMKEFSHPERGEMKAANINNALETTLTVTRNEWKYVAEVVTDFDATMPLVPCLLGEFNQVVLNLIINARDAIEETGQQGVITVETSYDADWAIVRISDTGAGMSEETRKRIFDPFYTTKEVGKGSGQGLAIAHNVIIGKHKGQIRVVSELGTGTSFELKLPRADPQKG